MTPPLVHLGLDITKATLVTQEDLLTPELVTSTRAALAARGITLTTEQITAVGEELSKVRIAALAGGRVVRRAFGYFTDEPTTGGTHPDPDFIPTLDNMNPNVRSRLAPDGQVLYESLIQFHRDGVLGDKAPTVTRVYDATTRATDRITLGAPLPPERPRRLRPRTRPGGEHARGLPPADWQHAGADRGLLGMDGE